MSKIVKMYYKCNDCGAIFDEPREVQESRGEFWGIPCSETMYYCPHCNSEDFDLRKFYDGKTSWWVSAYTQYGDQFGATIEAGNTDELFTLFREQYPDCEIADYGEN